MASEYECEVRFVIEDIKQFHKKLKMIGARRIRTYAFTDHFFQNGALRKNPEETLLRIRQWYTPRKQAEVIFVGNEIIDAGDIAFKRSVYREGKLILFRGALGDCRDLLESLGFEPWFSVRKRRCKLWSVPKYGFKVVEEWIDGYGWSGELETGGRSLQKARAYLENALKVLEIPRANVSYKPIAILYAEKRGLL